MSGEAIKGYDLLIELYDAEGTFLADFYITAEMFNSHFVKNILDDVDQIGKDVEEKINETDKKNPQQIMYLVKKDTIKMVEQIVGINLATTTLSLANLLKPLMAQKCQKQQVTIRFI